MFPVLSSQFVEFRKNRSLEPRYVTVQGTSNTDGHSFLHVADGFRATKMAIGDPAITEVAANAALPIETAFDFVSTAAGTTVTLAAPAVTNGGVLLSGVVKTIVLTTGGNPLTINVTPGLDSTLPDTVGANVTYVFNGTNWYPIGWGTYAPTAIQFPDGTVLLPSITFALDPDTGLYRPGANQIGITTGGTAALTINGDDVTIPAGSLTITSATDWLNAPNAGTATATGTGGAQAVVAATAVGHINFSAAATVLAGGGIGQMVMVNPTIQATSLVFITPTDTQLTPSKLSWAVGTAGAGTITIYYTNVNDVAPIPLVNMGFHYMVINHVP